MLENGTYPVPPGKLAFVITFLEMRQRARLRPVALPGDVAIERISDPEPGWYRDLFDRVGGRDWLWFSRLMMDDARLGAILDDPQVEVYAAMRDGRAEGLLELDFRMLGACELAFFGVTPTLIGTGVGRALMNHAIDRAWAEPIKRLHLQTCNADSPQALPFYLRSGFVPVRQRIDVHDDPRLTGAVPPDAGPHVPCFVPG
jgi:hypothetical protein